MKAFTRVFTLLSMFLIMSFSSVAQDDCTFTDCNCELTFTIENVTGEEYLLGLYPFSFNNGQQPCATYNADGTYTVTVDRESNGGDPSRYLLKFDNENLTNVEVNVHVEGCGIDENYTMNSQTSGVFIDTEQPCNEVSDCSTTDCTCELNINIQDLSGAPFELDFQEFAPGADPCLNITEEGNYTVIVDREDGSNPETYLLRFANFSSTTGVNLLVTVTGCGVDIPPFFLSSFTPPGQIITMNEPCDEDLCQPIPENCTGVDFDFCKDGYLYGIFNTPVNYVKIWKADWSSYEYLCKSWSGGPPCTGTVQSPNPLTPDDYHLEVNGGGGCPPGIIPFTVNSSLGLGLVSYQNTAELIGEGSKKVSSQSVNESSTIYNPSLTTELSANKFKIYPNPASKNINVSNQENARADVQIFSMEGKLILQKSLAPNSSENLDISTIKNGIYFVQFTNFQTKEVKSQKLIVIN